MLIQLRPERVMYLGARLRDRVSLLTLLERGCLSLLAQWGWYCIPATKGLMVVAGFFRHDVVRCNFGLFRTMLSDRGNIFSGMDTVPFDRLEFGIYYQEILEQPYWAWFTDDNFQLVNRKLARAVAGSVRPGVERRNAQYFLDLPWCRIPRSSLTCSYGE